MDSMVIVYACIIIVLVVFSAFFSLTETAFTGANRVRLKKLANDGDKKAEKALAMLEDYDKFLTTNLIGVNVVNIEHHSHGHVRGHLRGSGEHREHHRDDPGVPHVL